MTFHGVPLGVDPTKAQVFTLTTSRASAGHAVATQRLPLPKTSALIGRAFFAQWLVRDTGASTGFSATRAARFGLFAHPSRPLKESRREAERASTLGTRRRDPAGGLPGRRGWLDERVDASSKHASRSRDLFQRTRYR
jgi:hypothetical protein